MTDRVFVKICGVTTEADALLCVGLGVDAIGFVFAPSPRQVTVTLAEHIVARMPREVLTVGVFRDEAPRRVVEIAHQVGLGAVQLHGHESAHDVRWVAERVRGTIKAFAAGDPAIGRFAEFGADFIMVDGTSPGSGDVFDWRLAEGVVDPTRMIAAGGLTPDNVHQAIAHLHPYGVDVSTGVESAPGRKDPQLVKAFVSAVRAAEGPGAGVGVPGEGDPEEADGPYDWMGE